MSIIWAILISTAISYVLTSMAGEPFNFTFTLIVAGMIVAAVVILGDGALEDQKN